MSSPNSDPDQRQEYRLAVAEAVYIELDAGPDDEAGCILLSRSTDLSANGLQIVLDQALPIGHIYPLCIHLQRPEVKFVLTGEVKWCRASRGQHHIGIALFESDDTAIVAWKEEVARRLRSGASREGGPAPTP